MSFQHHTINNYYYDGPLHELIKELFIIYHEPIQKAQENLVKRNNIANNSESGVLAQALKHLNIASTFPS